MENYQTVYDSFLKEHYKIGVTTAEEVGKIICDLTQCFIDENLKVIKLSKRLDNKHLEIISKEDEQTGKPITGVKADVVLKNSEEYYAYNENKIHLENIQQCINSLKKLQEGVQQEYRFVSNT